MKHLNIKFLMMLICGTFVMNTALAATVNNKSSSFKVSSGTTTSTSSSDSAMAEKIRAQRAALDARDAQGIVATGLKAGSTNNDCDGALRKCIEKKCGTNYSKCATDSDIIFSDKLNACKKDSGCTAHEFTLFTTQIKEDKKQEVALAAYNDVVDCGNKYNQCIIGECGPKFAKCLSKSAGDKALNKCKQIAARCTEADSGMAGRMGNIFGIVRQNEEIQIAADEKKLYELRDKMESSCKSLGAMFDERSFDCVFTAYFFAGPEAEPKASKKLYAGSVFDCTPDWFGIDITTFKENAYRATRAQTAASSAMLGSGVGTAVGAITSGAINRAIETKKAKDDLKDACEESGKKFKHGKCVDSEEDEEEEEEEEDEEEESNNKLSRKERRAKRLECKANGQELDEQTLECVDIADLNAKKSGCGDGDNPGSWNAEKNKCKCPAGYTQSKGTPYNCITLKAATKETFKSTGEKIKNGVNDKIVDPIKTGVKDKIVDPIKANIGKSDNDTKATPEESASTAASSAATAPAAAIKPEEKSGQSQQQNSSTNNASDKKTQDTKDTKKINK